jgi:FkbM family methyltransferase
MSIKDFFKKSIKHFVKVFGQTRLGKYLFDQILSNAMGNIFPVTHNGVELRLTTPNPLCTWRAKTFSAKEPETLEWIDSMEERSIMWDVGANIGLYALYAAKKNKCQVLAFEPSIFNLETLARNIYENQLTSQICIVPLPLNTKFGPSLLHMSTTEWGGALSTFDKNFGWDGHAIRQVFEFQTFGISMDDGVKVMGMQQPDYIKMDVDGLEHFILKGGAGTLLQVKSVLIEINDDFKDQAEQCALLLNQSGLVLKEKRNSEMISSSTTGFSNSFNQIWVRH